MKRPRVVLAGLLFVALPSCEANHDAAPAPEASSSAQTSGPQLPTPPSTAEPVSIPTAPQPPPAPAEPFADPVLATTRRTLAHILEPRPRIGVYLGLPAAWRNDDPSYLLFFPQGRDPLPARAVALTLSEEGTTSPNSTRLLERGPEPTGLRDASWEPWTKERIGGERFEALVARGRGASIRGDEGPRQAIAAVVSIPGAKALGFVGSWASSHPEQEAVVMEMLRGVERCQIEVGRGCVTAAERAHASL